MSSGLSRAHGTSVGATQESASARSTYSATVSGSFHRHLAAIQQAVETLRDHGVVVLSPSDPRVAGNFGDFLFVRSDLRRSIKGVQNRHLESIRRSDFLWLVCPDGYVGQSAAMEIGFAVAAGIPVFSDRAPTDWTLRQYVTPSGEVSTAVAAIQGQQASAASTALSLVLEPDAAIATVRAHLDDIEHHLLRDRRQRGDDPVEDLVSDARSILHLPTHR